MNAFAEVANVIGGNIKGIVDQDCSLSLPSVEPHVGGGGVTGMTQAYQCQDHCLQVALQQG